MSVKIKERQERLSPLTIVMLVVLCFYCLFMFILIGWAFLKSTQHYLDEGDNPIIPKIFMWTQDFIYRAMYVKEGGLDPDSTWIANYAWIIEHFEVTKYVKDSSGNIISQNIIGFEGMLLNTILYAGGGAFVNAFVQCITAYLCARYAFKLSGIVYGAVIFAMVLPVVGSLPSEVAMARSIGLYDHIWGVWIMRANFLGMYFLVFHEMFKALPASYSEAATIDGASDWQILWRICFPLAKNTFFTILLLNFVTLWNDYQISMVYLPSHPTLAERLHFLQKSSDGLGNFQPVKIAAAFILMIPIMTLFLCFHKRLMGNLTIGGVKG
jgi:ABC-type glycerol-3-phosphate transport system permease component